MIEKRFLRQHAVKNEASFQNILREYLQHLFLNGFYRQQESGRFLFKGGTAMRLLFNSPRFSEDLDFSGLGDSPRFEKILEKVLVWVAEENIRADLFESKPTSGGHLAIVGFQPWQEEVEIGLEVSFRSQDCLRSEVVVVAPEIVPSYKIYALSRDLLVSEKVEALLARQKPRDYFDLYYILRKQELRQVLNLSPKQREVILARLEDPQLARAGKELKRLLPKSFWQVVNDFPTALQNELGRV